MSRASPLSAQGQSPDPSQDRYAPDPYLSAASDPEEIYFRASAIRLTPSRGSPGHSTGPGSSPHEDARIDSTIQGYLAPRANDYTDPSACTSPISDTSVFVEPKDIELGSGSTWQDEDLSSYRIGEPNVPTDPAWGSSMASNAFRWTSSDHTPHLNPSSTLAGLEPHGNPSIQQSTPTSYQSGLGALNASTEPARLGVLPDEELSRELASDATRGRSPVFKITTFSRGDSPKERSMSPQGRLGSFAHLSANPSELEVEDDGDRHSVSSAPVKRSENGGWIPNSSTHLAGIDPRSRGDELVPSPNDIYIQRERNEKNEDISHWSVSVSAANSDAGDSPSPPHPRPHHVSRRLRARSTGDHPLKQEDYFNLKSRVGDGFPGPGVLVHESSEELSEDEASIGTYSDEPSADVDELGRYDRSTPEVYSSLSPTSAEESICLYPWHDPPRDATPRSQAMQPDSSTDAMIAFNRRVRDLETASLAATIDNNSIINVITSLDNFSFTKQPKKRTSLLKRQIMQASSILKRQASDLSIGHSNSYPGLPQHNTEDSPAKPSNSSRNGFLHRHSRHSRSPSLSNALLSMTNKIVAVGGSQPVRAVSPAPSPNQERSSLNVQFKGRVRSRSEIPRPSSPGLINLMTAHGGPPVPSITSPRASSDADQTLRSTPLGPETGSGDDENDVDTGNNRGVVMDFPAIQSLPVPTVEGFRSQIMQLNPRLEPALIHRLAHEQNRRYKILVGLQQKHSIATANQTCKSGNHCTVQGGQPTLLQDHKGPSDPEAGQIQFQVTNLSYGHEQQYAPDDGTGPAAQFPPGVPLPPVSRLPARFECPICFEVKTFQKPSDWSKHVQEDVQPFTCTFPHCTEPKSFKRKADWVRHENEKHRHLEWWTCAFPECTHKCYRKDNFVQHLVREHKMPEPKIKKTGKASNTVESETVPNSRREQELERLWQMVEKCRHDTAQAPQEEPCRFCGNVCNEWRKLSVHLGKHLEQLALPILRLAKPSTATHIAHPSQVELIRGSSATYPSVAPYHHGRGVAETASAHLQPQYAIRNNSTPANPAFSINNVPLTDYSIISGGELSQEPESITDSLTPDQFPAYTHSTGQFGQTILHPAQAQAYPLHQNSVTYPPPYNAVPRSRSPEGDPMLQNSYPLAQCVPPSLYPVDGSYPAYQPMESNVPYTSATYSSGCPSRM